MFEMVELQTGPLSCNISVCMYSLFDTVDECGTQTILDSLTLYTMFSSCPLLVLLYSQLLLLVSICLYGTFVNIPTPFKRPST